jgi:hypothetical protein
MQNFLPCRSIARVRARASERKREGGTLRTLSVSTNKPRRMIKSLMTVYLEGTGKERPSPYISAIPAFA